MLTNLILGFLKKSYYFLAENKQKMNRISVISFELSVNCIQILVVSLWIPLQVSFNLLLHFPEVDLAVAVQVY